ncbi:IPT/TIG domain-containing protein [Paenibacillus taiwanensis]|uniref:IPT/TIG domain-containing protein n=1 Tax=Paenibacillus taiwanensis TaxID=401638 RepID=UPI0012FBA687
MCCTEILVRCQCLHRKIVNQVYSLTNGDIARGTVITIMGTNFIKGLKVYFGGKKPWLTASYPVFK